MIAAVSLRLAYLIFQQMLHLNLTMVRTAGSNGNDPALAPLPRAHGRNAKLQLSVLLAPAEPVDGLYRHPQLRRRSRRVDPFSGRSV